jgi:hypothetical protein
MVVDEYNATISRPEHKPKAAAARVTLHGLAVAFITRRGSLLKLKKTREVVQYKWSMQLVMHDVSSTALQLCFPNGDNVQLDDCDPAAVRAFVCAQLQQQPNQVSKPCRQANCSSIERPQTWAIHDFVTTALFANTRAIDYTHAASLCTRSPFPPNA